jgi:hypothetical protein
MTITDTGFADRYGPWALVAGASEGVGAAYARAMAERGLDVVLLARRQGVLDEVAAAIRADTGAEARAVAVDLAAHDAMARIVDATAGLEVGMVMYCAGADPNFEPFLAGDLAERRRRGRPQLCRRHRHGTGQPVGDEGGRLLRRRARVHRRRLEDRPPPLHDGARPRGVTRGAR